jgi:hypothetical protein
MTLGVTSSGVRILLWAAQDRDLHGRIGRLARISPFLAVINGRFGTSGGGGAFAQASDALSDRLSTRRRVRLASLRGIDHQSATGVSASYVSRNSVASTTRRPVLDSQPSSILG